MNKIFSILTALIISLSVNAQSVNNINDVPVVNRQQFFTSINSNGNIITDKEINDKFIEASEKIGGDAVLVSTNVPVYDVFAKDFYWKNRYNSKCGILILINIVTNTQTVYGVGPLEEREEWTYARLKDFFKDTTVTHTYREFYNFIADSVISCINDEPDGENNWSKYRAGKRTKSDPKVNKSFLKDNLTSAQLKLALQTPYVDTSEKVYDAAGLLSTDETAQLQSRIRRFINKYNTDMVIVTINQNNKQAGNGNIATENYAMDFYDYNDFGKGEKTRDGYDGVILVIDMEYRKFSILDVGKPDKVWHIAKDNVDKYISAMAPELTAKNYGIAINTFIDSYESDLSHLYSLPEDNWAKYETTPHSYNEVPLVDTAVKIYDAAELLSQSEISTLKDRAKKFIGKNKMDMVIVTINRNHKRKREYNNPSREYASDFYDENIFGKGEKHDGVILLIDMQNRTFVFFDNGIPHTKWNIASTNSDRYIRQMTPLIKRQKYYDAISMFIDSYETDYREAIRFPWEKCAVASLIIALLLLLKERGKYRNVFKAASAEGYGIAGSFRLTNRVDKLIQTYTTKTYNPPQRTTSSYHSSYHSHSSRSSYRSSGSSHRSSSGRSFGGGSGSF